MNENKPPLIVITGPTACGKSEVGVVLAQRLGTEIISADSVQAYKHFDIGSAKPSVRLLNMTPHHLIDIVEPEEEFNVARFKEMAEKIAHSLLSSGKTPLVVGGTGLYLKGLMEGLHCGAPITADAEKKVAEIYIKVGQAGAHKLACQLDPEWMKKIHPNDTFRTQRALRSYYSSGKTLTHIFSENKSEPAWDTLLIVLDLPRAKLYKRIEERVEEMIANGLREEVMKLRKMGYNTKVKPMRSLGYKEMYGEIEGSIDPDQTSRLIKKGTKAFAKRQLTWFRKIPEALFVSIGPHDNGQTIVDKIIALDETNNFFKRHNISLP